MMDFSTALLKWQRSFFVLCLTMSISMVAFAQTQFIGPNNGDWSTAANWSNGLPSAGNNALIGGGVTVVISQNLTANFNLDCFGSLVVNAGVTVTNQGTWGLNSASTWNGSLINQANFNNYGSMLANASVSNQTGGSFFSNGPLTLSTTAIMTNNATANLLGSVSLSGTYNNVAGSTATSQTFNALSGASVSNAAGATFANSGGGTVTISAAASMTNAGIAQNGGTWNNQGSMTNSSNFTNQVIFNNTGTFANTSSALFSNPGTFNNNAGSVSNAATATIQNGFRFNNTATVSNLGTFQNGNEVNNLTGATWNNEVGSAWSNNFGTVTTNAGTWNQKSTLSSDGGIINNGTYTLTATINSNLGGTITNNATFNNNGVIANINTISNYGGWQNNGILSNNSGGSLFNYGGGTFTNTAVGKIENNFEIRNKPLATFVNNGIINNIVRLFNEGSFTNNAYIFNPGDIINLAGSTFTNTELLNIENGIFSNAGSLVNTKTILISVCSELKNTGSINNTGGLIQNKGYVNQLGSAVVGNAIQNLGGYIKTTPGSAVAICNNYTAGVDQAGDAKVYAQSLVSILAIDSCSNFVYKANGLDRPVFHCTEVGTTQLVNLVVKDRLGDSLTCTSQVFVVDALEPQLASACPKDIYITTTTVPVAATWTAPTYIDNCTATPTVTVNFAPGATFPVGITGVVYTAKDASLNANTACGFKIIVTQTGGTSNCTNNTSGPTFTSCPTNITTTTTGGSAVVNWTQPTATDACFPISMTSNVLSGTAFAVGTSTVTYVASDGGNLTSTCSFTVTVNATNPCATDIFAPTFVNCPANLYLTPNATTGSAAAIWNAPGVNDNCTATTTANFQSGTLFGNGTTNVVYTATDGAGNTATCTFSILVSATNPCPGDVTAPTVTGCPANINLSTTTATAVGTWTAPTFADNCAPVSIYKTHNSGATFPIGSTKVTYTASDKVGNVATCSFDVIVTSPCQNDAVNPVITGCPASINLTTTGTSSTATWTAPTATDNCGNVSLMTTHLPGSTFPLGNTTVTYTATDLKGNAATCTFTVSVLLPPCAVTATASNIVCSNNNTPSNPADDTYTFNVTVNQNGYCSGGWTGGGTSGTYGVAKAMGSYPISAGNQVLSFSAAPGQSTTITVTAPATCSNTPVCAITAAVSNVQCNNAGTPSNPADDTYTFSVVVTQNGSCTGTWTGGGLTGTYGTATTFGPYLISGGNKTITFSTSTGQTTNATATAPAACSSSVTCTNNVLVNAGFETNTNYGWWTSNAGPTNTTAYSGLYSNCICDGNGNAAQTYPAYPGQTASFSLYGKKSGTPTWTGAGIDFVDINGNEIGNGPAFDITATAWTPYSLSAVAPAGTVYVRVWFAFDGTTGCLIVDDLCLTLTGGTLPTCNGSSLTNSGFESGTTGWGLSNGATVVTNNFRSGLKAASACAASSGGWQDMNVTAGQIVSFQTYAKVTGNPSGWVGVGMDFYDVNWNWIAGYAHDVFAPTYTLYALTATTPANAVYCSPYFWKEGVEGCLYVDDFCVSITSTCSNVTSAGTIGGAQTVCTSATPTALTNVTAPTGGSGNIEYIWLASTTSCPTAISQAIPGATSATYQPGILSQTTYYVRGARRAGCPNYVLSNCITVTYSNCLCSINLTISNQSSCATKVYWVNNGVEILYNNVPAWSSYIQQTYNTHQWRVRNASNGVLIGSYTVSGCSNQTFMTNTCGTNCPTGGLTRYYYANQTTGDLTTFFNNPPAATSTNQLTNGQGPSNVADNYITRVRGYIRPTVTGNYYLAVTGDDQTELWHSYTNQASGKQKVAYHSGWTNATELTKYSTQKSFAIWMEAGKDYYIELRHKEYSGGDHFGIWWNVPGSWTYNIIPGVNLVPFAGCTNGNLLIATNNDSETSESLETEDRTTDSNTIDFNIDGLRLFPNPADAYVNLDLSKFDAQPIIITVYDAIGRPIMRNQTIGSQENYLIDLTNFVNGTYNIVVQPEGKRPMTRTLLVAH